LKYFSPFRRLIFEIWTLLIKDLSQESIKNLPPKNISSRRKTKTRILKHSVPVQDWAFNFYPIVRLLRTKKKTWCVLVLLLLLCLSIFVHLAKTPSITQKLKSKIQEKRPIQIILTKKNRQNHQFIAIVDCVPKKVDLSICLSDSLFSIS